MLGVTLRSASLMGDKLVFASFPENYYRNTGEKVIDLDSAWIFDHNPFVVRGEEPAQIVDLHAQPWPQLAGLSPRQFMTKPVFLSVAERTAAIFNQVCYLRHPRLYAYENMPTIANRLVIHTTARPIVQTALGEDQPRVLSEEIIDHIRTRYRGYDVIQIGSRDDVDASVIDCRGLDDIWDTVRIIAQAAIYIGVDSGPSYIAACYPGVFRKKVLMQYAPEFLRHSFIPMHALTPHFHWHDHSFLYYNRSKDDAGVTYSYLKL